MRSLLLRASLRTVPLFSASTWLMMSCSSIGEGLLPGNFITSASLRCCEFCSFIAFPSVSDLMQSQAPTIDLLKHWAASADTRCEPYWKYARLWMQTSKLSIDGNLHHKYQSVSRMVDFAWWYIICQWNKLWLLSERRLQGDVGGAERRFSGRPAESAKKYRKSPEKTPH